MCFQDRESVLGLFYYSGLIHSRMRMMRKMRILNSTIIAHRGGNAKSLISAVWWNRKPDKEILSNRTAVQEFYIFGALKTDNPIRTAFAKMSINAGAFL